MAMDKDRLGNSIYDALKVTSAAQTGQPAQEVPVAREIWKTVADEIIKEIVGFAEVQVTGVDSGGDSASGTIVG
jgi:hypothetical protein